MNPRADRPNTYGNASPAVIVRHLEEFMADNLDAILQPRSVAVIGASRKPGRLGWEIVHNLLEYGFNGTIYPINPSSRHVHSIRAWPSIEDVEDPIDLAVLVVPRDQVLPQVEACARKGVRGLLIISAGFREVGDEGRELEEKITHIARKHGMRVVGPNCMGVINADPNVRLDASFAETQPIPGSTAFASQSGAVGEVILSHAHNKGLGISQFVSLGNKADVSGNDLLEWWCEDPNTRVVLLYLESFGNPRNFVRIAREITRGRGKPILAVKSGRTRQGAAAASSHTGSLAGGDQATTTLFEACGVTRCNTVEQLFDLAAAFSSQPLPVGNRMAVLTNAGGPGIMATDSLVHFGLEMAELSEQTTAALRGALPPEASVRNPVDMIASAGAAGYRACTELLLADPNVDALVVLFVSPVIIDATAVADAIVEGVRLGIERAGIAKPVLSCIMGAHARDGTGIALLRDAGIPNYAFPETAAHAMSAMVKFRAWRDRPLGDERVFQVDRRRVAEIIERTRASGRSWVGATDAFSILDAYGIPVVAARQVQTPEQAHAFAEEVGYPVVLKLDRDDLVHKSDIGGVQVDLRSEREIKGAFWEVTERLEQAGLKNNGPPRFQVQKMVTGGQESIIGAVDDPVFGHMLMFGLGGVFVELMKDVVFQVHPITDEDARRMIHGIKGLPLLQGYRGSAPADMARLQDVLLRVNQLVGDFPEISEMDLNPFLVLPEGGFAVDVRVRLRRSAI